MPKADGSVLIITEIDSDGVAKGTKKIKGTLEDLGKDSQSAGEKISGGLSDSFKKLGTVLAAAGIVDKLVDVGKQSFQLGSDLQEVQNVVDVTFSTMSDRVDEFAKAASASAGLSETMAKKYVGTFGAMADSFGFAEAEAYEMSTALTQLTGDVASFYNISQDEAYTKLKSVFTGETESLKELGVVMTQTALDAYAMANGFGKVTADMTEQEKVALRYQFVMEQLSGASGDFARTQESWANQTRVLQLQWESLLAVLGSGLIQAVTPIVQFINEDILPALTDLAAKIVEAFEPPSSKTLEKNIKSLGKSVKEADKQFSEASETIEKNALMADRYAKRLAELEATGLDTAESQRKYANVVSYLNSIYPELNLEIDEQTKMLNAESKARLKNISALKQEAIYKAQEERYTAILEAQADAVLAVYDAEYALVGVEEERAETERQLSEATGLSADELINLYKSQTAANSALKAGTANADMITSVLNMMGVETGTLTRQQMTWIEQLIRLTEEESRLKTGIEEANATIAAHDAEMEGLSEQYGFAANDAKNTADAVDGLADAYGDAAAEAQKSLTAQIDLFEDLGDASEITAESILENWRKQQEALNNFENNLQKAINMGYDKEAIAQLENYSEDHAQILQVLADQDEAYVQEFNSTYRGVTEAMDISYSDAVEVVSKRLGAIKNEHEMVFMDMADIVTREVDEMQSKIDSMSGKTFYIKAVTSSYGGGGGSVSMEQMPMAASVPMLATGAVIPPNAPFLAMLGDQRNGTNIEAPLDTIKQALSEVMAEQGTGGDINLVLTGDLAQLAHVLKPYIDAEGTRRGTSLAKVVISRG